MAGEKILVVEDALRPGFLAAGTRRREKETKG